jgi:hypothetical protein
MRFRADDLRRQGWAPPQTLQIPDWCGCSTEYLPVPAGDGWWSLVPIWADTQPPAPLGAHGAPTERDSGACDLRLPVATRPTLRRTCDGLSRAEGGSGI